MPRAIQLYLMLLSVQVRSQMQYRVSFLLETLSTGMVTFMWFGTLALVLEKFDRVGGWTLGEVAFLFSMAESSFGVMDMLFSGFDPQFFGLQVRRGFFDQLLLRPAGLALQVFGSKFVLRRLGRIFQGLVIFAIALSLVDIRWTAMKALYLPVVFASLVCFFGGLFVIGATITFWTIDSIEVVNIFTYGGSEMISYPMHIYTDGLRQFFTWIVPAIFLNYYPALYFLDKADPFGLPAWAPFLAPAAGLVTLAAGFAFWQYGLKHYQSTGT